MPLRHPAKRDTVRAQERMFAEFVGPGLHITRAQLAQRTGIPEGTLTGWAKDGAVMPVWAVSVLARHLPPEAINVLFVNGGMRLVPIERSEANWHALAASASKLTSEICDAQSDGRIDHVEEARLKRRGLAVVADLQAVCGDAA